MYLLCRQILARFLVRRYSALNCQSAPSTWDWEPTPSRASRTRALSALSSRTSLSSCSRPSVSLLSTTLASEEDANGLAALLRMST